MIWSLGYTRLSYHEQAERAIGQIYVSVTTNNFYFIITYMMSPVPIVLIVFIHLFCKYHCLFKLSKIDHC
jgi:hypothetical protein